MKLYHLLLLLTILLLFSCTEKTTNHSGNDNHAGMENCIMLSNEEILKANIQVDTVRIKNLSEQSTLTGVAAINENEIRIIASRVKGRLEHLYVRNTGQYISKGELLYGIYSEELLADENDYILALEHYTSA